MTTEEKAKAYEMALEAAREELKQDLHESGVWAIKRIFPELRESEDERIRSAMIRGFNSMMANHPVNTFYGVSIRDILSYLEKQKELTPADGWDYADKRMSHPLYLEGFEAGRAVERELSEFVKQKEQKPVEKQDYSGLTDLERAIHRGFLCAGIENVPTTIIKETAKECLKLIDNYRPVEWSEEDEHRRQQAINALDRNGYYLLVDWLKSLRPQKKEDLPKWRRIRVGEKIPCRAYLYKLAYENENNFLNRATVDGLLIPNEPVTCGCDTWYLPVDEIKNLPKED